MIPPNRGPRVSGCAGVRAALARPAAQRGANNAVGLARFPDRAGKSLATRTRTIRRAEATISLFSLAHVGGCECLPFVCVWLYVTSN